jgi:CPA2 family monovalent cation:H+ antiporter-2
MRAAQIVETAPLVLDVGIVLLIAATLGFFARKIGLPAIIGYLLTGLLVSPFTPGYVAGSEQLAILADIGVILLLFEVGIEIDLRRLRREQRALFWASPLQIVIGTAIGAFVFVSIGIPLMGAILIGLSVAMSSSVVIVNIVRSRRRTTNPDTETALVGWSIMQDISGVVIGAVALTIVGAGERTLTVALLGLVGFGILSYAASRALPKLLRLVKWEQDLFLIYSVSFGLVLAALGTVVFGIPMALAAFVAGLALNQSRETDEVRRVLLPFRDLFAVLFFVVIGSLITVSNVVESIPFALLLIALLIFAKTIPAYLITRFSGLNARPAQLAVGLSQLGEFAFVLGSAALVENLIDQVQFTAMLMVVVLSIIVSSLAVRMFKPQQTSEVISK